MAAVFENDCPRERIPIPGGAPPTKDPLRDLVPAPPADSGGICWSSPPCGLACPFSVAIGGNAGPLALPVGGGKSNPPGPRLATGELEVALFASASSRTPMPNLSTLARRSSSSATRARKRTTSSRSPSRWCSSSRLARSRLAMRASDLEAWPSSQVFKSIEDKLGLRWDNDER